MLILGHMLGFVFGCSGLAFSVWIGYNLLVEETTAFTNIFSSSNLAVASALAGLLMAVIGFKLAKGPGPDCIMDEPEQVAIAPEAMALVQAAALEGRVIEAVKLYRDATGVGLKDAKEAVDQLRQWAH